MANGLLQVVSEGELQAQEQADAEVEKQASSQDVAIDNLAAYIRSRYHVFKNHRTEHDIDERATEALRSYNGTYNTQKLQEINKFGGSDVYARLTTVKCRGATAMLRDVFLGTEKPWALKPTPVPDLPVDIIPEIEKLIAMEVMNLQQKGVQIDPAQISDRHKQLVEAAEKAAFKEAEKAAKDSEKRIEDVLLEGGFYSALAEFLIDLPIFQYACVKGPIVQNKITLVWNEEKQLVPEQRPIMCWHRVSPFDLYLDPGAGSNVEDASVIERIKLTRAELNSLIGLPGYNDDDIRKALEEYGSGLYDWIDEIDTERTELENKENPHLNRAEMIDTLEWHGPIQGKMLIDQGFTEEQIPDPDVDYNVEAWIIGRFVIKVQINPNPRKRHPYYITSFEKVPGSPYGHGLPEIMGDVQAVANASLRALVNNMSVSSGPQVVVNEDRMHPTTDSDSLYPWKRWKVVNDPLGDKSKPVEFFQPNSNAQELLGVYNAMQNIADEVSAIPRYITGSEKVGGAATTASGLSMLQSNATKVLQNVASNIDRDVIAPLMENLYDMVMVTDTEGQLSGDSEIVVRGMEIALAKEQDRMRRLEFLSLTANPMDMEIVGLDGRAAILRSLAQDLGLPGEDIVPSSEALERKQMAQQQAMAEQAAMAQGTQNPKNPGAGRLGEETDNAFRNQATNVSATRNLG